MSSIEKITAEPFARIVVNFQATQGFVYDQNGIDNYSYTNRHIEIPRIEYVETSLLMATEAIREFMHTGMVRTDDKGYHSMGGTPVDASLSFLTLRPAIFSRSIRETVDPSGGDTLWRTQVMVAVLEENRRKSRLTSRRVAAGIHFLVDTERQLNTFVF